MVSSFSFIFLILFFAIYVLPECFWLTNWLAANQMAQQMGQMNPAAQANPFQPGQDPHKLYVNEAENLEVVEHFCILDGIEERVLRKYGAA